MIITIMLTVAAVATGMAAMFLPADSEKQLASPVRRDGQAQFFPTTDVELLMLSLW